MRQAGTNLPKVGRYNRAVVLDQIQLAGGISRVEIAQQTGLTPQTVSGIVRRLLDEGIVREDGASRVASGGKPRTTLRVNADAGSAVGLVFDPVELTCAVVDLLGRPLVVKRRPTPPGTDPAQVVPAMAELVADVLAEAKVPRAKVLGLGLATPGPIDQKLGMIVAPPQLAHWTRVPLQSMLSEATGLPVTIDNDATAAAVGERWSGAGRGVANFAYLFFGTGIGGGLVLNHQVYRGGSFNAGEFGHSSVLPDGPECYCGNRGCLEELVNPPAIVAEVHRRLAAGGTSVLSQSFDQDPASVDHAAIQRAAAAGDPVATAVIDEAADHVASVAVSIANFIDVDLIILGGHGIQHVASRYVDAVASALANRPLARHIRVVEVAASPLGTDAAVVGGAALVLHATYSPQLSALLSD
ncbi:ROK family transcriptional regulator [Streptomyces luteolifulvus]|uniref:ROK family transcriptional regulator n=1 Tax=Streptomyces luteolifulvus TaxID=2615112 RepID=A0A6H9UPM9_9ACTN|nr:ROK family transcriptional regulator [Streptomyces luteolifulvus]KAB1140215.1 ROK family transcriptional regulator [Streptomyces luteolifulvus]